MIRVSHTRLPLLAAAVALACPGLAAAHVMPAAEASIAVSATVVSSCTVEAGAGRVSVRCSGADPGSVAAGPAAALPFPTADETRPGIVDAVSITY